MIGTQLAHILGIWLIHFIDDILWHIVWYRYTWLMYMGVVHNWHTIWHGMDLVDVLLMILYSLLTYLLLHDVWYRTSLMHGQV
jgi:hypothetical protein